MTGPGLRNIGFQNPGRSLRPLNARKTALAELIMTLTLVLCIMVAGMVVSIGIARAGCAPSGANASTLSELPQTPYR